MDEQKSIEAAMQQAIERQLGQMTLQILELQARLAAMTAERDALRAGMRPPTNGATHQHEAH
jgi:hypothetical protein